MKKKTYKIIICISLVVMLFTNFSGVFGAVNESYETPTNVSESALDKKIKDSILLDALANMLNAIASLAEYLIGAVFESLTGDKIFPWADRIIFNAIPFLDINFLNPDEHSLFGSSSTPSILGEVVQKVYSTIFSLAVLFLGVAVGVMAIRLAISSIAAEKAKYKQAIVNWATCIVMLFLMHYILAFVFWVNEQMVTIASGIFLDASEGIDFDFSEALNEALQPEERLKNYLGGAGESSNSLLESNIDITNEFLINDEYIDERMVYKADTSDEWQDNLGRFLGAEGLNNKIGLIRLEKDVEDAKKIKENLDAAESSVKKNGYYQAANSKIWVDKNKYKQSSDYTEDLRTYIRYAHLIASQGDLKRELEAHPERKIPLSFSPNFWTAAIDDAQRAGQAIITLGLSELLRGSLNSWDELDLNSKSTAELEQMISSEDIGKVVNHRTDCDNLIWEAGHGGSVKGKSTDIIANLGYFFKKSAYVYNTKETTDENGETKTEVTGWRASKLSVTGALLYAIFVFQSCLYFVTYVKRLFFVIMLSMFGPLVVIYDFFMKSAS